MKLKPTLTPALSHPMGEGELFAVSVIRQEPEFTGRLQGKGKASNCCSLSRPPAFATLRLGEAGRGQGEGQL